MGYDSYTISCHVGQNPGLRLKPSPEGFIQPVTADTSDDDAFSDMGFCTMEESSARMVIGKDGILKVCLTEGNVPLELTIATFGEWALLPEVTAIALWIIRGPGGPNYRVVITKDDERFPLGMKV